MTDASKCLSLVAALAALLILGGGEAAAQEASARPLRVMSLNLCTDQLVLMLLPASQITSVSWLARDPSESMMTGAAQNVAVNYGQAEEVLRDNPDLVVAGTFTTPTTRAMLRRLGYPLIEVDTANNFEQVRAVTRQVGEAVHARAKAEQLVQQMDKKLALLENRKTPWRPRIVSWDGGGYTPGKDSLFNAILSAAGARNIAAEQGVIKYGTFDVEALIAAAPDLLIEGDIRSVTPGLREDAARHPFIRRYYAGRRITVPQTYYTCGTPRSIDAATSLRDVLDQLAPYLAGKAVYAKAAAP